MGFGQLADWTTVWVGFVAASNELDKRKGNRYRTLTRCTANSLSERCTRLSRHCTPKACR